MSRPRKYLKGEKLDLFEVVAFVMAREYVMQGDRPIHPSFMMSRRLNDLSNCAKAGMFFRAIPNPEHKEP